MIKRNEEDRNWKRVRWEDERVVEKEKGNDVNKKEKSTIEYFNTLPRS